MTMSRTIINISCVWRNLVLHWTLAGWLTVYYMIRLLARWAVGGPKPIDSEMCNGRFAIRLGAILVLLLRSRLFALHRWAFVGIHLPYFIWLPPERLWRHQHEPYGPSNIDKIHSKLRCKPEPRDRVPSALSRSPHLTPSLHSVPAIILGPSGN